MNIRKAIQSDLPALKQLLHQLDYNIDENTLWINMQKLLSHPDEELIICEVDKTVIAFISIHFIPQLALKGDFARISYLAVDDSYRGKGIGKALEEYCTTLATERNCDRIELHCHERRSDAHKFYSHQNYIESPKYLMKKIS